LRFEGVYSIIRFELSEEGGSTKIVFDQAGFPEEAGRTSKADGRRCTGSR
jgi:hypothetical protein